MDRVIVRGMVEDYWRAMIPAMQNGGSSVGEISQRFEERINHTATLLPPVEGAAFLQAIEAEREQMISAYQTDPAALKKRLGVALGRDAPTQHYGIAGRQGLGELAVRTAVRATIWETIWRLFR